MKKYWSIFFALSLVVVLSAACHRGRDTTGTEQGTTMNAPGTTSTGTTGTEGTPGATTPGTMSGTTSGTTGGDMGGMEQGTTPGATDTTPDTVPPPGTTGTTPPDMGTSGTTGTNPGMTPGSSTTGTTGNTGATGTSAMNEGTAATGSDATITASVKSRLSSELGAQASNINVETTNGMVTLTGIVTSQDEADRIVRMVRDIDNVTMVHNNLTVSQR